MDSDQAGEKQEGKSGGGFGEVARALSAGPLKILALAFALVEAVGWGGVAALNGVDRTIMVVFVAVFPILVLAACAYLSTRHPEILYGPTEFKDESMYERILIKWQDRLRPASNLIEKYPETAASLPRPESERSEEGLVVDILKEDAIRKFEGRGVQWMNSGKAVEAVSDFEKAVQLGADSFDIWRNLGFLYANLGEADKGLSANRRALEIEPNAFVPRFNLAVNLLHANRPPEDVLAALEEALEVSGSAGPLELGKLHLYKGHTFSKMGRLDDSIESYRQASTYLEQTPRSGMFRGEVRKSLGDALARKGDKEQAKEEYKNAIEAYAAPGHEQRLEEARQALNSLA